MIFLVNLSIILFWLYTQRYYIYNNIYLAWFNFIERYRKMIYTSYVLNNEVPRISLIYTAREVYNILLNIIQYVNVILLIIIKYMCGLLIIQSDQKVAYIKINVFLNSSWVLRLLLNNTKCIPRNKSILYYFVRIDDTVLTVVFLIMATEHVVFPKATPVYCWTVLYYLVDNVYRTKLTLHLPYEFQFQNMHL